MNASRIAIAALLAFSAIAAQAHGTSVSQSAGFEGDIDGQLTTFDGSANVGASSIASGSSVSAGEVLGNGGFQESATGKTVGVAGGTAIVTPTGVVDTSFTQQSSVSSGKGSTFGDVPVTAADGSIITGNQAFGSVSTQAVSESTFATQTVGANLAIGANEAIQANGENGFN